MNGPIRILLVEDVPADAELALRELKRAMPVDARRVETYADYRRELEAFRPQVVLCDFSMPKFDGLEALRIAKHSYPDIPFIFVSGTIGEESAVTALNNGARDYVLKGNLLRLPAAVERAIKETEERRIRRAHEEGLRASEKLYKTLFKSIPYPILMYDAATLQLVTVNDAATTCYGYSREELLTMTMRDLVVEKDYGRLIEESAITAPTDAKPEFWKHRTKSSDMVIVQMAFRDLEFEERPTKLVVVTGFPT